MPASVSSLSLKLLGQIRLLAEEAPGTPHAVWVKTRMVEGFFPADRLRNLIQEREDLSYLSKTLRNADRDGIPGFTFLREGDGTLNDYFKGLPAREREPAAVTS
ncbi:MAG: hypothetical protein HY320_11605 [Armatimonadetes bacterium]|nr:hypothetical protein [Armatimonadota bacterium]